MLQSPLQLQIDPAIGLRTHDDHIWALFELALLMDEGVNGVSKFELNHRHSAGSYGMYDCGPANCHSTLRVEANELPERWRGIPELTCFEHRSVLPRC